MIAIASLALAVRRWLGTPRSWLTAPIAAAVSALRPAGPTAAAAYVAIASGVAR